MSRCEERSEYGRQCTVSYPGPAAPGAHLHEFWTQQLGQVLSPDPRGSLFSSAVPATPPMRSWIHQVALEAGVSKQENLNYPASISSVAMMSEAGLDDRLILLGDRGERTELPMAYLAHLWPTALKFPLAISFERQLTLFTTGPAGLVVLIGVRM